MTKITDWCNHLLNHPKFSLNGKKELERAIWSAEGLEYMPRKGAGLATIVATENPRLGEHMVTLEIADEGYEKDILLVDFESFMRDVGMMPLEDIRAAYDEGHQTDVPTSGTPEAVVTDVFVHGALMELLTPFADAKFDDIRGWVSRITDLAREAGSDIALQRRAINQAMTLAALYNIRSRSAVLGLRSIDLQGVLAVALKLLFTKIV